MTLYTVSNLTQKYSDRTVLQIDSLSIQPGEIFALVGPSGAGKSTLLRLLGLIEQPSQGQVTITLNGRPVTSANASIAARRQIAMVFQRPVLISTSVRANIAFGLRVRGQRNCTTEVEQALERLSLLPLIDAKANTLSGGEMQRVAVARALVLKPQVLLLDEPTANLDPYNVRVIEDRIREQHRDYGTTMVLVTHNIFQARRLATRVALILDGELIEVAATESFFNSPHDPRTSAFISGELVY